MPHAELWRPCRHHPLPGFALGRRPRRSPAQAPPRTRLLPDLTAAPLLHASRRQRESERRQPERRSGASWSAAPRRCM